MALGRVTMRQDIDKVSGYLRSMSGVDSDAIVEGLPGHKRGEFVIMNPNHLPGPTLMQGRWLATEHRLVGQDSIGELITSEDRERLG